MLFRRRTFPRWLILIPIVILLLIGAGIAIARGRPTVVEVFPAPDTLAVPGLAPVRVTFSRPMNPDAVEASLNLTPSQPGTFVWEENTVTFTPDEPWPGGAVISVTVGTGARTSLGIPLVEAQTWSFSVARTMLAYLWPADGSANLYMLDPVGGAVVQLTDTGGVREFSVGPGGLVVYFSADNGASGSNLWRLDMLTRTSEPILDCGSDLCALPQLSPDGQGLVYENTTKGEVWLLEQGSGQAVFLGRGTRPQWSSAGTLAFYEGVEKTFRIVDTAGAVLASYPNQLGEPGTWSTDGAFFTAPDTVEGDSTSRLFAFLALNGLLNDLSGDGIVEDMSPVYSPDGQWLVFARKFLDADRWTPGRQVWLMDANGDNPHALTDDELYSYTSFAWSPDSLWIAFVKANRTAPEVQPELWMIGVDGSNLLQLVIGGYAPQWIP